MRQSISLWVLTLALFLAVPSLCLADNCLECHRSAVFKVKHKLHYDYHVGFESSAHGQAGLSCFDCHGGDRTTPDEDRAHQGVRERVKGEELLSTCGACHGIQYDAFISSEHYLAVRGEEAAPDCVSCHGSMQMETMNVDRVREQCIHCHENSAPDVESVYSRTKYVLSQINTILGYKEIVETYSEDTQAVTEIDEAFEAMTAHWHRFDLKSAEEASWSLLGLLRTAKDGIRGN